MHPQPFNIHHSFRLAGIFMLLICFYTGSYAQQADTLGLLKEYLQLGSSYQQRPLYLELEQRNTTNLVIDSEDTAHSKGLFYLLPGASYVRFGAIEQFVNDSITLLISNELQQMILFRDAQPVLKQMQALSALPALDTSAQRLAVNFTVQPQQRQDTSILLLSSRRILTGTTLPREMIELHYDRRHKVPVQMISVKRTLVPLEAADYKQLEKNPAMAGKLFSRGDKEYYLIRERIATITYKHINHDPSLQLPVVLSERVKKSREGKFEPVQPYQHYQLTIN